MPKYKVGDKVWILVTRKPLVVEAEVLAIEQFGHYGDLTDRKPHQDFCYTLKLCDDGGATHRIEMDLYDSKEESVEAYKEYMSIELEETTSKLKSHYKLFSEVFGEPSTTVWAILHGQEECITLLKVDMVTGEDESGCVKCVATEGVFGEPRFTIHKSLLFRTRTEAILHLHDIKFMGEE